MPREVLVEFTAPEELTGVAPGTKLLRYGVDADEFVAKKLAVIVDENPAPRNYLLTDGIFDVGVLAGSQTKMSEHERKNEQQFLLDQVKALDQKHEREAEQKKLKAAVQAKRLEVSRG